MHLVIAGSSGFLGHHLVTAARAGGHDVTRLVRRPARDSSHPAESQWDPYTGTLDPAVIDAADVVVNLAGSPTLGNPHSSSWASQLRDSRVTSTRVLARAIATSSRKPAFLAGNAVGWYGAHGTDPVDEGADSIGDAFMTQVCRDWQDAAQPAVDAGGRVCFLRTAPVMDSRSAPLKQLRILFSTGLGGRIGSGEQYFPMIARQDWVDAVLFLAAAEISGPVNVCCAETGTNADLTDALAEQLSRPAKVNVPELLIRTAAGRLAPDLLGSVRTVPRVLLDAGFGFAHPTVRDVVAAGLKAR